MCLGRSFADMRRLVFLSGSLPLGGGLCSRFHMSESRGAAAFGSQGFRPPRRTEPLELCARDSLRSPERAALWNYRFRADRRVAVFRLAAECCGTVSARLSLPALSLSNGRGPTMPPLNHSPTHHSLPLANFLATHVAVRHTTPGSCTSSIKRSAGQGVLVRPVRKRHLHMPAAEEERRR